MLSLVPKRMDLALSLPRWMLNLLSINQSQRLERLVFWHVYAKTNEDQLGGQKFINYPNIHCILHFFLKLWNDTEQTFKSSQLKVILPVFWKYCLVYTYTVFCLWKYFFMMMSNMYTFVYMDVHVYILYILIYILLIYTTLYTSSGKGCLPAFQRVFNDSCEPGYWKLTLPWCIRSNI